MIHPRILEDDSALPHSGSEIFQKDGTKLFNPGPNQREYKAQDSIGLVAKENYQ